jgi:hypothetical protein
MQAAQTSDARIDPIDDDIVAFKYLDKKLQALEPELFRSKWFDYRMMTPVQATRLYIEAFSEIYRSYFATEINKKAAPFIKLVTADKIMAGLEADDRKAKSMFSSYSRGRQVADAIGMPYKHYIHITMGYRLRFWQQRGLPQPHQLYASVDVEKTIARWEEMQAGELFLSEHPAYMLQNYHGLAHQDDYHEWLIKQAGIRSNPAQAFARFINDDLLPLDKVSARLDPDMVMRVHSYLR